jgi:hypothetical protein
VAYLCGLSLWENKEGKEGTRVFSGVLKIIDTGEIRRFIINQNEGVQEKHYRGMRVDTFRKVTFESEQS